MLRSMMATPPPPPPLTFPLSASSVPAPAAISAPAAACPSGSATPDAIPDDWFRLVYAQPLRPALFADLWSEVGSYASHSDQLSLRAVNKVASHGVDKFVRRLTVHASQAPALLTAFSNAVELKHIDTLVLDHCTNINLPVAMAALSQLPHATINLRLVGERCYSWRLSEIGLEALRHVHPKSISITSHGRFAAEEARILAALTCPIHLTLGSFRAEDQADLRSLASVPRLALLEVRSPAFTDETAEAFSQHPALTALRLRGPGESIHFSTQGLGISDRAITTLADSATLKLLAIGETQQLASTEALAALAGNRHLEHLTLGMYEGDPFDTTAALTLSASTSLKTLSIDLTGGYGHLAKIPSLERLSTNGRGAHFRLADAREFALHARLHKLDICQAIFERGSLAVLATSAMPSLTFSWCVPDRGDMDALLANQSLLHLDIKLAMTRADSIEFGTALAGHPSLQSLRIKHDHGDDPAVYGAMQMTEVERAALFSAWGPHRPQHALVVDF